MDVYMGHCDMGPTRDPLGEPDLPLISSFIKNFFFHLNFTDAYQFRPIGFILMKFWY